LEEAYLVYYIGAGLKHRIGQFLFGGHDEEGEGRRFHHGFKPLDGGVTGHGHAIEFVAGEKPPGFDEVFELSPKRRTTMADEDSAFDICCGSEEK
jgi:hypothetical protein